MEMAPALWAGVRVAVGAPVTVRVTIVRICQPVSGAVSGENYGFPGSRYFWGGEADERAALQRRAEFMREQISAIEERLKEIGESDARE